ncbi:MAG: mechanosensitive ion channel family protein, partial [Gemmatimonadota bacterium]
MDLNEALQAIWDKVAGWLADAIEALPNLIVAILIMVAFVYLARLARRWTYRLLGRVSEYRAVNRLLSTMVFVALLAVGAMIALTVMNLDTAVASILGAAGILGLAVGFAAQSMVENLIAGILISLRRPLREGDLVETNDVYGVVQEINLRATVIATGPGQTVYVPNGQVVRSKLVNYTKLGQRRIDIECGVSYADDLEKAKRVAIAAIEELPDRVEGRGVDLFYREFGGSSINFLLTYWIPFTKHHGEFMAAQSEAVMALKRAFDENDISIPFPIRTLDFGIEGGVALSSELR